MLPSCLEKGCLLPRDLLESGIGKEDKAMKKLQSVLTRLKARQAHQASLNHEAKAELHNFRVGWIFVTCLSQLKGQKLTTEC